MRTTRDDNTQVVQVKRWTEGHTGEDGKWVEGQEQLIAVIDPADIQPKSGTERAGTSQTQYYSNYNLFAFIEDIEFLNEVTELKAGDKIVAENSAVYTLVFPGFWGTHYQGDLRYGN